MAAIDLSQEESPQGKMVGFRNYLEKSLRDPFVINLEGCSLTEVILAGSCAFLWDSREVTKVMFNGRNENLPSQKVTFGVSGEHYTCVFLTGSYTGDGDILIFQVHPLDETGEVTRFYFSNVYDEWQGNPCHKIENGHYYVLHPTFITEIEDGQFSISFPDWICSME